MNIELGIHNPDSGRLDNYVVTVSRDQMTFGRGRRVAICTGLDDDEPKWENDERPKSILKSSSICPPAGFAKMLVRVWLEWRDDQFADAAAVDELKALTEWLNVMTRAKPRSKFRRRSI